MKYINYFHKNWWSKLSHLFNESGMIFTLNKIRQDIDKNIKVLPESMQDCFKRFMLAPDEVRVVFLTEEIIGSFKQSKDWRKISSMMEYELYEGLWLNLEENMDYLIPKGIINLSPSLTINNKGENYDWQCFVKCVIHELMNSGNKILWICCNDYSKIEGYIYKTYDSKSYKYEMINLQDGIFKQIEDFYRREYNQTLDWSVQI